MQSLAVAILVKSCSAQYFQKTSHPLQRCIDSVVHLTWGAIGSASAQQLYQKKKKEYILSPGRAGGGSLQRLCRNMFGVFTFFLSLFFSLSFFFFSNVI